MGYNPDLDYGKHCPPKRDPVKDVFYRVAGPFSSGWDESKHAGHRARNHQSTIRAKPMLDAGRPNRGS